MYLALHKTFPWLSRNARLLIRVPKVIDDFLTPFHSSTSFTRGHLLMVPFTCLLFVDLFLYLNIALKSQKFKRRSILMTSLEKGKNQGSDARCLAYGDTGNF